MGASPGAAVTLFPGFSVLIKMRGTVAKAQTVSATRALIRYLVIIRRSTVSGEEPIIVAVKINYVVQIVLLATLIPTTALKAKLVLVSAVRQAKRGIRNAGASR